MKVDRETMITTIYVIIDTLCNKTLSKPPQKQKLDDAQIVTIAICSDLFFNSNHDKALVWLRLAGFFPKMLSLSRFNRRLHRLNHFIEYCFESLSKLFLTKELYIIDSMPVPVCKRVRASRNKKVKGRKFYGHCAAKQEDFFGFRLHLIVDTNGIPVSMAILPGAHHDITRVCEVSSPLPENSIVIGDKAYNCKDVESFLRDLGIVLMPLRRKNMKNQWSLFQENFIIRRNRRRIETTFSILSEVMGINHLKSRTCKGLFIKIYASVIALIFHITEDKNYAAA